MSNAVKAIIVAIVVVGAVAVLAAAISFNLFNRVTTVEENSGAIEAKIVTVDQKVDVVTKKIEELSEKSGSNLEPAVEAVRLQGEFQRGRMLIESGTGISFEEVYNLLEQALVIFPHLNDKQKYGVWRDAGDMFIGNNQLDSYTVEQQAKIELVFQEMTK